MDSDAITAGQIISLKSAMREVSGMVDGAHVFIVNHLLGERGEINKLNELSRGDWQYLRAKLYPNWRSEDWTLGADARIDIATYLAMYREEVTGQKRLF